MQPLTRHAAAAAVGSIGAATPGRGTLRALRAWIDRLRLDARTRYLSASIDHADCERRMRNWDAHEQQRIRRPWTC